MHNISFEGFYNIAICKKLKSNHHLLAIAIFLVWKWVNLGLEIICVRQIKHLILEMSEILDYIYKWVSLVNIESVLAVAFVKYSFSQFYSFCINYKNRNFEYFLQTVETLTLWPKNFQNLWRTYNLDLDFRRSYSRTRSKKTAINQELLVVETCQTARWIAFLMFNRFFCNIPCHFHLSA